MRRLIRSALYHPGKADQHYLRQNRTSFSEDWSRAAEGFRQADPDGCVSYQLLRQIARKYKSPNG